VNRLIIAILFFASINLHAQKFLANNGQVTFFSDAPLENISAINNNVSAVFDASTNDLVFQLKVSDFIFPKALMQEHFNENYLESDIYPNATFLGKVTENNNGRVIVKGDLKIHGITNNITVNGEIVQNTASIIISANFTVKLEDYSIKIPTLVMYKIAEEIEITVNIELKQLK
tara:strand:+ start:456 stop:977 length:522 start_codon:yes stop_codon:yes gene_type:complete